MLKSVGNIIKHEGGRERVRQTTKKCWPVFRLMSFSWCCLCVSGFVFSFELSVCIEVDSDCNLQAIRFLAFPHLCPELKLTLAA